MEETYLSLKKINDILRGYVDETVIKAGLDNGSITLLNGRNHIVATGQATPVKINTNIGIADKSSSFAQELEKLKILSSVNYRPDIIMDHTICPNNRDFWREILTRFDGPVGTLPHYTAYHQEKGFDGVELLDRIEEMLQDGVAFMTLHFTADIDIYEIAKKIRSIPVTSRGGGLVLRDTILNKKKQNVFRYVFSDIVKLFKKYNAAISIGTTFRPANIFSALDKAHVEETKRQLEIVAELKRYKVKVLMEGVGHLPIDKIKPYIDLIHEANCPFMPLGPMTTDSAIGFDHVTNAIGGVLMATQGGAHILNSVTREEHSGGVPDKHAIIEGLKTVKVAAHSINVSRFEKIELFDKLTIKKREQQSSCVVSGGLFESKIDNPGDGCNRCSFECPILLAPK